MIKLFGALRTFSIKQTTPEKLTFVQRSMRNVKTYWKNLGEQYLETLKEIKNDIVTYPFRTCFYLTSLGTISCCCYQNPSERDFHDEFIKYIHKTILINRQMIRKQSLQQILMISKAYDSDCIRYTNFFLFSIIWIDRYSQENRFYESQSPYFAVTWSNFFDHVIDFGFLNRWWLLDQKMINYDVPDDDENTS